MASGSGSMSAGAGARLRPRPRVARQACPRAGQRPDPGDRSNRCRGARALPHRPAGRPGGGGTRRAERASLDAEIARVIVRDPALTAHCQLLTSAPGVGPIVAATLIAELPELGALDRRRIARLAGLAPVPATAASSAADG